MHHRLLLLALCATTALALAALGVRAQGATDAHAPAMQVCASCHGPHGNSTNPEVPSIAGQVEPYLQKQLAAFKAQRREGVMGGVAMGLSDAEARDAAAYFSSQPAHWNPQRSLAAHGSARGRSIYVDGIGDKQVPACASCHALHGEGLPPEFPRLAGQHASYIAAQLRAFRSDSRLSNPNAMMRAVSAKLSDAEIGAVSDYIEWMHR
ncbi:MAG TPA: c-type cytochrome [Rhodanobacter sp.]|nr:c-type cytochrome [Rhodanobacter sp.]